MDKWFGNENYVEDILRKNKPLHYVLAFEVHDQNCRDQFMMMRNNKRDDKIIVIDDSEVNYIDNVINLCDEDDNDGEESDKHDTRMIADNLRNSDKDVDINNKNINHTNENNERYDSKNNDRNNTLEIIDYNNHPLRRLSAIILVS